MRFLLTPIVEEEEEINFYDGDDIIIYVVVFFLLDHEGREGRIHNDKVNIETLTNRENWDSSNKVQQNFSLPLF